MVEKEDLWRVRKVLVKDEEIIEGKGGCSYYKRREIPPKRWGKKPNMKVGGGHQTLRFGGHFLERRESLSLE